MKTLCIAGMPSTDLRLVGDTFLQAGMAPPRPSRRDEAVDMDTWHAHAVPVPRGVNGSAPGPAVIGQLWRDLAGDIVLANLNAPLWGWCRGESVWALDFWADLDPAIRFVLVCLRPEQRLADLVQSPEANGAAADAVGDWHAWHQAMLDFYLRRPERAMLVSAEEALAHPDALLRDCAQRWDLPLEADAAPRLPSAVNPADDLAVYLARQLLDDGTPEREALTQELTAARRPLVPAGQQLVERRASLQGALDAYRDLARRASQLGTEQERVRRAEELAAYLQYDADRLEEALALRDREQQALAAEVTERRESEATLRDDLTRLELQHRQVVEERESLLRQRQALQDRLRELEQARAREEQAAGELLDEMQRENDALLARLHELQEDLEETMLNAEDAERARATSEQALRAEVNTRDETIAALRGQLSALEDGSGVDREARDKLKEAEEENELLLLQLHQVQEELEHYFLEHQSTSERLELAEARWQRMLRRHPDYCDFRDLQVSGAGPEHLQWRFQGLEAGGRAVEALRLESFLDDGKVRLQVQRNADGEGPFLRWPEAAGDTLALDPKAIRGGEVEALARLAASDWELVRRLPAVLQQSLARTGLGEDDRARLQRALEDLRDALEAVPPALRYDRVRLRNAQANPDYEHLWLDLSHPALGDDTAEAWTLRVSCASVGPERFGTHPKLEFPEEAAHWLEGWYAESQDDHGPKLELRFAVPQDMDVAVWKRLSERDRALLRALVDRLPDLLEAIRAQGAAITRPWDDWHALVRDIGHIQRTVAP